MSTLSTSPRHCHGACTLSKLGPSASSDTRLLGYPNGLLNEMREIINFIVNIIAFVKVGSQAVCIEDFQVSVSSPRSHDLLKNGGIAIAFPTSNALLIFASKVIVIVKCNHHQNEKERTVFYKLYLLIVNILLKILIAIS